MAQWEQIQKDMENGGATKEEAKKEVANIVRSQDISEKTGSGILTNVVKYNDDFNVRQTAANQIVKEGIDKTLADGDRKANKEVQEAWKLQGTNINALDGVFDTKKIGSDEKYLGNRVAAGDPTAKGYVKQIMDTGSEQQRIDTINSLSKNQSFNSRSDMISLVGQKSMDEYDNWYKVPSHINFDNVSQGDIVTNGKDVKVKITDGMGTSVQVAIVIDGKLVTPEGKVAGKNSGIYYIPGEYGKDQNWTIDVIKYGKEVLNATDKEKAWNTFVKECQTANGFMKWYTCDGKACGEGLSDSSGGGGGGGGGSGGSSGGSSPKKATTPTKTPEKTPALYVESNVDAKVYNKGSNAQLGQTNTQIPMTAGTYTIEVRKLGYSRVTKVIEVGNYPVNITMNMYKAATGPATFIASLGGEGALTKKAALFIFCIYKARITTVLDWRTFAFEIEPTLTAPDSLSVYDVRYVWYLANGETVKAKQLLTDGLVTLTDGEE